MIGETIDKKYALTRLLGKGGMGSVYEARRVGTDQRVAVKVIDRRLLESGSAEAIRRFRREARAASSIDSEHITGVIDTGEDEATGLLYLVMEYLEGEDLQQLLDRQGPLDPEVALRVAAQALAGLEKAHQARVIHRDIKPANLFLARRPDGAVVVKVLDFGIAKFRADPLSGPQTTGVTRTGNFLGSPVYMSPEQVLSSRDVDHRTDVWSLGCVLYCALAGRAPHGHIESVGRLVYSICSAPPLPLEMVAPWVPAAVAKAVHAALAIKAEDRYQTAAAMLEAIVGFLSDGTALREDMLVPIAPEKRLAAASALGASVPPEVPAPRQHDITQPAVPEGQDEKRAALALETTVTPIASTAAVRVRQESSLSVSVTQPDRSATPPAPGSAADLLQRRVMAGGLVLLLLGAGAAWMALGRARPAAAGRGVDPAPTSSAAPAPTPADTSADTSARRVRLIILPGDAKVLVDGALAQVNSGVVEIAGRLGSGHRVRVEKGSLAQEVEVFVTDRGAQPPRIELNSGRMAQRPPVFRFEPGALPSTSASAAPSASAPPFLPLGDSDPAREFE